MRIPKLRINLIVFALTLGIILNGFAFYGFYSENKQLKASNQLLIDAVKTKQKQIDIREEQISLLSNHSKILGSYVLNLSRDLQACNNLAVQLDNEVASVYERHYNEMPLFISLAMNISQSYEYDIDSFNCVDFANVYISQLATFGQRSEMVVVTMPCPSNFNQSMRDKYCYKSGTTINHAIVKVDDCYVDPVSGTYVEVSEYKQMGLK